MKRILFGGGWLLLLLARLTAAEQPKGPAPASAAPTALADVAPLVRKWTPPVYPVDALKAKIGGRVVTRVVVDEVGNVIAARVLNATDPKLGDAALAAVKLWKFAPARENSKPVYACLDVPLEFDAAKGQKSWKPAEPFPEHLTPQLAPRIEAVAKTAPRGAYPVSMLERRLPGRASFVCIVRPDGGAQGFRIIAATHPDFVLPALVALERWEFAASSQGDLSVASELKGTVEFDFPAQIAGSSLSANGISAADGKAPAPELALERIVDPVWPYDLLVEGQGGSATAEFTVQPDGKVSAVKLVEATRPEFGRALTAAVEQWTFSSRAAAGPTEGITLVKRADFKPPALDEKAPSDQALGRLAQLAREGKIGGGLALDDKLVPVYQVAPRYPEVLLERERPTGRAMIEFVIDREGRCRLPRILSATADEFGWAAATAVGQWIFKAPRRAGQPTEVRVQIPINFSPPDV